LQERNRYQDEQINRQADNQPDRLTYRKTNKHLAECDGAGAVAVGLLDTTGGRGGLASSLGGQLRICKRSEMRGNMRWTDRKELRDRWWRQDLSVAENRCTKEKTAVGVAMC
jgi:hypothetical protein